MNIYRIFTASVCALVLLLPSTGHTKYINRYFNVGEDITIAKYKDVEVRAQCTDLGGGDIEVIVYAKTSAPMAVLDGEDDYHGNGNYLTPATLPDDAEFVSINSTSEFFNADIDQGFVLSLTTFAGLSVQAETSVLGVHTPIADCLVSLNIEKINKPRGWH